MDVDLLSKMVKELILDNDKVVLPGLGAFVAEIAPAAFTDKGYTINPPYRRLSFRSKPDEGDLLTKFYASSNDLEYNVADKVIRDFVSELRSILCTKKTVILPGLGRLRATKENAIFFISDEDLDIYPEGFALEPISLKTHQETREEVRAAVGELKAIVQEPCVQDRPVVSEETPAETYEYKQEERPEASAVGAVSAPEEIVLEMTDSPDRNVEAPANEAAVAPDGYKKLFKIVMWLVIAAVLLLIAFVGVSRLYPSLIDNILYSAEELEILNKI